MHDTAETGRLLLAQKATTEGKVFLSDSDRVEEFTYPPQHFSYCWYMKGSVIPAM